MTTVTASRTAIKRFIDKWTGIGDELSDGRSFWIELVETFFEVGNGSSFFKFEKRVKVNGAKRRIDAYLPATKVLIEQKSIIVDLSSVNQQTGETPYEQARAYAGGLRQREYPRWIITCNFKEFRIYDMNEPDADPEIIFLSELEENAHLLSFLLNEHQTRIIRETKISVKAGEIVKKIYQALKSQYGGSISDEDYENLNKLCVRLVFCLYAEDSSLFESRLQFHDFLERQYSLGANQVRSALIALFDILNTPYERRDPRGNPELNAFPYVNGGLFEGDNRLIPILNDEIVQLILHDASEEFDWSEISPTIFGAIFESTLESNDRRSGGMHYTSIENIEKVINPLFMDELKEEFEKIKSLKRDRRNKLLAFQSKLGSLKFLDPACGSGNFLTETYIELRRMENEILELTEGRLMSLGPDFIPIQVHIDQFYGIEINDFAVSVAQTALWIAESQMLRKTEDILEKDLQFLPLKSYSHIVKGNALRTDWNELVPVNDLNYIIGNPPFVGMKYQSQAQKSDISFVNPRLRGLDYVTCWFYKAWELLKQNRNLKAALVATNSICQGEQVAQFWEPLLEDGLNIIFAYRPFVWENKATRTGMAHVHCVIIGFSAVSAEKKYIYDSDANEKNAANMINAYLADAENIYVRSRNRSLFPVHKMIAANKPCDYNQLKVEPDEYQEMISDCPEAKPYLKRMVGAQEFINNLERWCLWLVDCTPEKIRSMRPVFRRVQLCKAAREDANTAESLRLARTPWLFREQRNPSNYLIIPCVSSEARKYIPMGFLNQDVIPVMGTLIIPEATIYEFGILTSRVHMIWMSAVAGRLEMRYRYSKDVVYNNFPWPNPTEVQKEKIKKTAKKILEVREQEKNRAEAQGQHYSLASIYNDSLMPLNLQEAHEANDKAVMKAYGFSGSMTDAEILGKLMKLYKELVQN